MHWRTSKIDAMHIQVAFIRNALLVLSFFALCTRAGHADSFDTFDDHEKLSGGLVIAVGNASEVSRLSISQFEEAEFYQLGDYCFAFDGGNSPNIAVEQKPALLIYGPTKNVSLAQLATGIGSIKVTITPVTLYDCDSLRRRRTQQLNQQVQEQMRDAKALRQRMQLQLEQFRANLQRLQQQQ